MKYKISFCDDIELLVTADSEVEAVKKAKEVRNKLSDAVSQDKIKQILDKWYKDGFATWSYRGAKDGKDGKFGGSFHYMGDLIYDKFTGTYRFDFDFGSANRDYAMDGLDQYLKSVGMHAEIARNGILILPN